VRPRSPITYPLCAYGPSGASVETAQRFVCRQKSCALGLAGLIIASLYLLTGCGQKGPLYMPSPEFPPPVMPFETPDTPLGSGSAVSGPLQPNTNKPKP
jgi:predicted small lipoprotein YifL